MIPYVDLDLLGDLSYFSWVTANGWFLGWTVSPNCNTSVGCIKLPADPESNMANVSAVWSILTKVVIGFEIM